jgi:hypothetical protein
MTQPWDEFTKSLVEESVPRRESLRRLGAVLAGAVLGPLGMESALAGRTSRRSRRVDPCKAFCTCRNKSQQNQCLKACSACNKDTSRLAGSCGGYICCGAGQTPCGSYCTDLNSDIYNCGACGSVCDQVEPYEYPVCIVGECDYFCVDGALRCGDTCTDVGWDPDNCGACGNICSGETPFCYEGACIGCPPELALCDNACIDVTWDANNCGACGNVCGGSTPYCNQGECSPCWPGGALCDGQCVDLTWNANHCGACGNVCGGATPYCSGGQCTDCEGAGGAICSGACTDILWDANNCGGCGYQCQPQEFCSWGVCEGYCNGCY